MAVASIIGLRVGQIARNPSPIYPNWVLEGNPVARNKVLSSSADGSASTIIWDCTAGRFNWIYDVDETIYVIHSNRSLRLAPFRFDVSNRSVPVSS
jgi:uncharacterized cupin superfamily protein